jgi:hypothetical protein
MDQLNSSTTNISLASPFVGAYVTSVGVDSGTLHVFCNLALVVSVDHSLYGANALSTQTFDVSAQRQTALKFSPRTSFYRIRAVIASGTNPTTNFVLACIRQGNSLAAPAPSTTNDNGIVGLNVYSIYPKRLVYRIAGSASAPVASQFLGPEALAFDGNTFNIGLNYPSNFNIYLTSAGTRSVDLDYIDANGNRALTTITINNTDTPRLTNVININNMNWTPTSGNVDTRLRAIARTSVYRNQLALFYLVQVLLPFLMVMLV